MKLGARAALPACGGRITHNSDRRNARWCRQIKRVKEEALTSLPSRSTMHWSGWTLAISYKHTMPAKSSFTTNPTLCCGETNTILIIMGNHKIWFCYNFLSRFPIFPFCRHSLFMYTILSSKVFTYVPLVKKYQDIYRIIREGWKERHERKVQLQSHLLDVSCKDQKTKKFLNWITFLLRSRLEEACLLPFPISRGSHSIQNLNALESTSDGRSTSNAVNSPTSSWRRN